MSDTLIVTSISTGAELARITLDAGELTFQPEGAASLFGGLRRVRPPLTDAEMFELRSNWSNGYIAIQPLATE